MTKVWPVSHLLRNELLYWCSLLDLAYWWSGASPLNYRKYLNGMIHPWCMFIYLHTDDICDHVFLWNKTHNIAGISIYLSSSYILNITENTWDLWKLGSLTIYQEINSFSELGLTQKISEIMAEGMERECSM